MSRSSLGFTYTTNADSQDPFALNFGTIYNAAIRKHSDALTRALHRQLPTAELRPFGPSGNLAMIQARILVSISPRNGFVLVQDTADMASPGRVGRFAQAGETVSRQPLLLAEQVALLKFAVSLNILVLVLSRMLMIRFGVG